MENRVISNLLDQVSSLKAENAALRGAGLQGVLLGMGNPLLDISAEVPMSMCEKYGLKMGDAAMVDENNSEKLLPLYQDLVDNYNDQLITVRRGYGSDFIEPFSSPIQRFLELLLLQ